MTTEGTDSAQIVKDAREAFSRSIRGLAAYHMNACVKCGLCAETCHIYLTDPVPANHPAVKANRVIDHYRRYHTLMGRVAPFMVGARDLTEEALDELTR